VEALNPVLPVTSGYELRVRGLRGTFETLTQLRLHDCPGYDTASITEFTGKAQQGDPAAVHQAIDEYVRETIATVIQRGIDQGEFQEANPDHVA
jgi:hypothetical protein